MGCTSGIAAAPCEYPAIGYNCRGMEESVDPENGNFLMKCHPNCSWKWRATGDSTQKIFYIFPVLADQIGGLYVSFNCVAIGNPAHDPVLIQLEMVKADQKTILINLLARAFDTAAKVESNINSKSSIIQNAAKGDVCRLKCTNLREGTEIHISHLTAFMTSKDEYSCVRLPFEEFIKEWNKTTRRQVLSVRSFNAWQLRSLRAPIGWTQTPPLHARPNSIDGIIEFDIVFESDLDEKTPGNSPQKFRKNSIRSNPSSPERQPPGSPDPLLARKQSSTAEVEDNNNSSNSNNKRKAIKSRRLSSIENTLGLSTTPDTFGEVRFSINLVRNYNVIMSYIIIDQKRLQLGHNRIAFHINEKLSSPLLKLFRPGDYYQIDRYHSREDIVLQVKHFHLKLTSAEKRPLCVKPYRQMRLLSTSSLMVSMEDELTSVEAKEDREAREEKLEYDSFYYFTPAASQYPIEDRKNEDLLELFHEIHHRKRRGSKAKQPPSGWGSWIDEE